MTIVIRNTHISRGARNGALVRTTDLETYVFLAVEQGAVEYLIVS